MVTGTEADRRLKVVDAELHDIEQPVKTYSTGMSVRLMFATSPRSPRPVDPRRDWSATPTSPRRVSRGSQLSGGGTRCCWSHDVYAAARLCDRMIWLDRGRIILDGPSPRIVTVRDSIRLQEEEQLHHRRLSRLSKLRCGLRHSRGHYIVEISARQRAALRRCISAASSCGDGGVAGALPLGSAVSSRDPSRTSCRRARGGADAVESPGVAIDAELRFAVSQSGGDRGGAARRRVVGATLSIDAELGTDRSARQRLSRPAFGSHGVSAAGRRVAHGRRRRRA
jgi:hypothetical protein